MDGNICTASGSHMHFKHPVKLGKVTDSFRGILVMTFLPVL